MDGQGDRQSMSRKVSAVSGGSLRSSAQRIGWAGSRNALAWGMYEEDPIPALKQQVGELLAKELANWRRWDIAQWIQTEAPRVTDIRKGRLQRFSLETLLRYASRLRYAVEPRLEKKRIERHQLPRLKVAMRTPLPRTCPAIAASTAARVADGD